jgi:hypothetical protein
MSTAAEQDQVFISSQGHGLSLSLQTERQTGKTTPTVYRKLPCHGNRGNNKVQKESRPVYPIVQDTSLLFHPLKLVSPPLTYSDQCTLPVLSDPAYSLEAGI